MSLKNMLRLSWLFGFLIFSCQAVSAQIPPFRELARMFDYDRRAPLDVEEHSVEERDGAKVYDISVDAKRLGFVGFSFGATLGGILAGVRAEWFRSRIGIAALKPARPGT